MKREAPSRPDRACDNEPHTVWSHVTCSSGTRLAAGGLSRTGLEQGLMRGAGDGNRTRVLSLGKRDDPTCFHGDATLSLVRASVESRCVHWSTLRATSLWH